MAGVKNQVIENKGVITTEFLGGALTQKDVKNEGWSSEFIENKRAKKVVLRVYSKQSSYPMFAVERCMLLGIITLAHSPGPCCAWKTSVCTHPVARQNASQGPRRGARTKRC
jgi:hypothetical protein